MKGDFCNPKQQQFRQHPQDYIDSMKEAIQTALSEAPQCEAKSVVGVGVDTTGSTPVAVDAEGKPLALLEKFKDNPNAMFVLWKDHTALKEAEEINHHARNWGGEDVTKYVGGIYSSEWFFAKILHVMREDEQVRQAAVSWVEHCDWIPALLGGIQDVRDIKRSRCAAGHKAMWHESWDGLPPEEFFVGLDPILAGLRENLFSDTFTSDQLAGYMSQEWAEELGLTAGIPIAVGAFDCHMGAVGANMGDNTLAKVMGTSTCDMATVPKDILGNKCIPGICGQVNGSIMPGQIGLEAGQSAFGDIYAWFKRCINGPALELIESSKHISEQQKQDLKKEIDEKTLILLTDKANASPELKVSPLALDWLNGRRTPDANQALKGALINLDLGTDAASIFKALVEASAYGSRAILDRMIQEGVEIDKVIALGGIAKKSDFVMQICSDVLNKPIRVVGSDQCCALGAAMFAAKVAGCYENIEAAQAAMNSGFVKTYQPRASHAEHYENEYRAYLALGEHVEVKHAI
jgi:L-ribulokinase